MRRVRHRRAGAAPSLPWWLLASAGIGVAATLTLGAPKLASSLSDSVLLGALAKALIATGIHKIMAGVVLLLSLAAGAIAYRGGGERRRLLARQKDLGTLRELSWQEFERLVGEAYRRRGFNITETGQGGADGGVDLVVWKDGRKTLVQVKQWRSASVGASVVREMLGLMVHHRAHSVAIVTCGRFTKEAWKFAVGKPIDLVGGVKLIEMIKLIQDQKTTD